MCKKTLFALSILFVSLFFTTSLQAQESILGEIKLWAGDQAPRGWMFCHGQELDIQSHGKLFSVIGATYGGNGRSNFKLPDFRGRVPIGAGQDKPVGATYGLETVTLTPDHIPGLDIPTYDLNSDQENHSFEHGSNAFISVGNSPHGPQVSAGATMSWAQHLEDGPWPATRDELIDYAIRTGAPMEVTDNLQEMEDEGGTYENMTELGSGPINNVPINIVQASLGLNYIISIQGIYPTRQ